MVKIFLLMASKKSFKQKYRQDFIQLQAVFFFHPNYWSDLADFAQVDSSSMGLDHLYPSSCLGASTKEVYASGFIPLSLQAVLEGLSKCYAVSI